MWEIRSAATKGLGVFAKSFIPRGTRIFSERPLLAICEDLAPSAIWKASALLSPSNRQDLLALSAHNTAESAFLRWNEAFWHTIKLNVSSTYKKVRGQGNISPSAKQRSSINEHVTILHIFRSNAFQLGLTSQYRQAVFRRISRINHSCIPNTQGNFHDLLGRFNIHAVRDIMVDEELTLNYLPEQGALRASRQTRLLSGYGFTCGCPACDLSEARGRSGEEERMKMHMLLGAYAEMVEKNGEQNPEVELQTVQQFIQMLEGEGIAGRELSTMYLEAAKLNQIIKNYGNALSCAEKGLAIEEDCLGTDHPLYIDSLKFVQTMKPMS